MNKFSFCKFWMFQTALMLTLVVPTTNNIRAADPDNQRSFKKPNVVFILADDLGWRDLSNEGSTFYESPHIDRIAHEGMKFTRGYAACQVCSPSRAAIMTGKAPARVKITDYIGAPGGTQWKRNTKLLPAQYQRHLAHEEVSLAEAFKEAGYVTFFAGKWHLGDKGSFPEDHGFDFNVGGHHRGTPPGGYFSPYNNPKLKDGPEGELLPLRLGQETANFIRQHRDQPFFAFLSFYSVHGPIQSTEVLWKKYREKASQQTPPDHRFIVDRTSPVRQVQDHPLYAGMVESMDDAVGLVLDTLDELKLADNTIVVFTSDNGGVSAGDGKATSNLPLRGGKGRQWEGGIREPYYIKWPGVVAAGSTCSTPVIGMDFYPTLLEMAELPMRPDQHVDGTSLVPLLRGQSLPTRSLYWHYPHYGNQGGEPSAIIQQGDWKLIQYFEDGRRELYHITEDVGEQDNRVEQQPERAQRMANQLRQWQQSVDATMPTSNPNFDAAKYATQQINTREKTMPSLERQAASFLKPDYKPGNGWLWKRRKK